jgi:ribosomal-protein-alanine N-acetyltransferase
LSGYFLQSARLAFRCWTEADVPLAVALWGDAEVTRHLGGQMTAEQAEARMRLEMERQGQVGVSYWPAFEKATGVHAGCAGLRPYGDDARVREVGVHIARRFWSGRYGEEAARAVIGYGFGELGLHALMAGHGPDNVNSKALIERLGFRFTHMAPWGAEGIPHPWYRLERADWMSEEVCRSIGYDVEAC